jgi:hypothetical protein
VTEKRYDIPLEQLERETHVPLDELVMEQGEPPPPLPIAQEELDRQRLLGVTAAGRLR